MRPVLRLTRVSLFALPLLVAAGGAQPGRQEPPVARPNDNRTPAGALENGVLSLSLVARMATWHPDGDSLPGLAVEAFGEAGRAPSAPGPLVRVPVGTELRFNVRNTLERDTLTFYVPSRIADTGARSPSGAALDSVVLTPGEARELRVRAARPGSYLYHANGRSALDRVLRLRGLLTGAIIVDSARAPGAPPPRDRVLVLLDVVDSLTSYNVPVNRREVLAINGRSWPHTERLSYTVGDTVRWRILNGSPSVHPMHLHGFYFRVEAFDGSPAAVEAASPPGRLVVTERMAPFTSMTLAWVPEREGNWLFHCHFQAHAAPHRPLGPTASSDAAAHSHADHATRGMGGLVMGVHVAARRATPAATTAPRRRLRLVAVRDSGFPDSLPSMRFVLEDRGTGKRVAHDPGFSPTIDLVRNEPASITVVNQLGEPLSVHWHGIELDSYYDGVAGFAGSGQRIAPLIAARDSFEARMTPPRSGTFMYHSHVDEERHHRAGLVGALIVHDRLPRVSSTAGDSADYLFFLKSARAAVGPSPMEINGRVDPDTLVLRVGKAYRFRFINLAVTSPNSTVHLTARPDSSLANLRDTLLVQWRNIAKDGADLPARDRVLRPATQVVSIGETHDIEFVPTSPGVLRLEVRPVSLGRLTVRLPIRVQ